MWNDLTLVLNFLLSTMQQFFSLYASIGILSAVLAIWIVRKVLKTFNLI